MITREFDLMLYQEGNLLFINANQYDSGEQWIFTLYEENGVKYTPATGAIVGVKSDGHGIINTGTVDEYGRVVINETQQMTAAAGLATFELLIDNDTHGTANFKVDVEPRPADNADLSDSDLSLIQEAIDSAEVIVEVIGDGDPSEVIGEHVDAWLDNHPEATTTVLDGAITAPKINQSLWDKLLVSEEASGAVASFDDGADDVPVSSLKVALEPIQTGSGDPSPTNIRPIYPANNRNQFPSTADGTYTNSGITVVANNGVYTVTGTGTATSYIEIPLVTSVDLSPSKNQLAFMNTVNDGNIEFAVYRDSTRVHYWAMSPQNRVTKNWTDTGNEVVNKIRFNFQSGMTYNITISPVLCLATYPTPTAFTPYQGIMVERTGKNLLNVTATSQTINGVTFTVNSDGTILANGTASANISFFIANPTFVADNPSGTYFMSGCPNGGGTTTYRMSVVGATGSDFGDGVSVAYSGTITDARVRIVIVSGTVCNNLVFKPMIRLASDTDSTFEPYTSTSYPYTLGQNVYGGTVDLATGVLTMDRAVVTLNGSETWGAGSTNQGFYTGAHTMLKASDYTSVILCDKLKTYERMNKNDYYEATNGITGYNDGSSQYPTQNWIYAKGGSATTPTEFKTWLASNPLQVVYLLATPTTVQLTPTEVKTLLGYNNISSTGTVDVIYHADTKLYVDKMTAVDNNIIAPTEVDFVATRNYTVNDLVIVNDMLYKVTANIANGGAITPNSNVQQTTLSALIKAFS